MEEERRLIVWNTSALDRFADELEVLAQSSYSILLILFVLSPVFAIIAHCAIFTTPTSEDQLS